jgi:predicted enzyme related to lactoylglutathione lyase
MAQTNARFVGVELYFEDLDRAKKFYLERLKLQIAEEQTDRYAKFDGGSSFVCLEKKGTESYPSRDKAVLFFEVADLQAAIAVAGPDSIVQRENTWAVMHDPEGHNVVLLQTASRGQLERACLGTSIPNA